MLEKKKLPHFESFVIEEEEGSGIETSLLSWFLSYLNSLLKKGSPYCFLSCSNMQVVMALFTGRRERIMENKLLLNVYETSLSYTQCFCSFKF